MARFGMVAFCTEYSLHPADIAHGFVGLRGTLR
jgi:hypothetical protein